MTQGGTLPRVVPRTYRTDVYQGLRAAILDGTLPSGSPLVERRISDEMGVSRAPVREALRKLEEEGLVVTIPYKGTYVTRVSPEKMEEILSLRTVLERFAAERAVSRLSTDQSARLKGLLTEMEAAGAAERADAMVDLHMAFHRTLYEAADHALLLQIWSTLESQLRLYGQVHQLTYESLRDYAEGHRPIVDALVSGDAGLLRACLEEHLGHNTEQLIPRRRAGKGPPC